MHVNYSLAHGIIAGGASAYLQGRLQQEAAEKSPETWTTVALQVNHLLLLTAETIRFGGWPLGSFGCFVQTAYILTPLSLLTLFGTEAIALTPEKAAQCNQIYRIGVIAASLTTLALANPVFAASSLSMLTIDMVADGTAGILFAQIKKITALCALIGYGAQVFISQSAIATAAKVSTALMGMKLCIIDPMLSFFAWIDRLPKENGNCSSREWGSQSGCGYHHVYYCGYTRERDLPYNSGFSYFDADGAAQGFCRPSVW